jgi:hypothetical protein
VVCTLALMSITKPITRSEPTGAKADVQREPRRLARCRGLQCQQMTGFRDRAQGAGFTFVATARMDEPFRLPTTRDYLTFVRESAGPILQILKPLDETARSAAWSDIEAPLDIYQTADGRVGPNTLLLATGQR